VSLHLSPFLHARAVDLLDRARNDVLDLAAAGARRLSSDDMVPRHIDAGIRRRRPPARHRMMPLLEMFAQVRPNLFFIQIGSHDGQQQDSLHDMVIRHNWAGIMVEPVPYVFQRLRRNYGHLQGITFENVAIGPVDGSVPFYHLPDTDDPERAGLPVWFDGLGSLRREVLVGHERYIPDIHERLVESTVPCLTFESLCRRNGVEAVDLLNTDTEGYDYEILKSVDFNRIRPKLIVYESAHLTGSEQADCVATLESFDYETLVYGLDTWCLNPDALAGSERKALLPTWRWLADAEKRRRPLATTRVLRSTARRLLGSDRSSPSAPPVALTDAEQRYLATGYDDSVPLPAGVSESLSETNPRLLGLRATYADLDLPAVRNSARAPGSAAGRAELAYFRGHDPQRGQPEHPRALALKLFVYMRHLEGRGGRPLLDALSEDGLFGCWTTEVEGYGTISRDLLDSVSEILFLDQQMDVLKRDRLRVLDVGAGYGRLAHRFVSAHPTLEDYCCVDTVPEATFVSEYYLHFRGCTPPARVVALDRVGEDLHPGSFDLAVSAHGLSTYSPAAIEWWSEQVARLEVPHLFVVSGEHDHDVSSCLRGAGYQETRREPAIDDVGLREMTMMRDEFSLFTREGAIVTAETSAVASA
jgi:FkbM family methyltransferase